MIDFFLASLFRQPVETLLRETIQPKFVKIVDNDPDATNPGLFFPLNVQTGNGIVHTIDRVLRPIDLP